VTPEEHQATVDIARLHVHEYFDHYLTDVFPAQMERLFRDHNKDSRAHGPRFAFHLATCVTKKRLDRARWMLGGGSAVGGFVVALFAEHLGDIIRLIW